MARHSSWFLYKTVSVPVPADWGDIPVQEFASHQAQIARVVDKHLKRAEDELQLGISKKLSVKVKDS